MLAGWGAGSKVFVSDTLLSMCTQEETEALIAHEIGHYVHRDLPKRWGLKIAGFFVIVFVIKVALDLDLIQASDRLGMSDFVNMPVLVGIWVCTSVYPDLVFREIARRQESAADSFAWALTKDVRPFISAMRKLHKQNLLDYSKSGEWRFAHPATDSRVAAAEAFLARQYAAQDAIAE